MRSTQQLLPRLGKWVTISISKPEVVSLASGLSLGTPCEGFELAGRTLDRRNISYDVL